MSVTKETRHESYRAVKPTINERQQAVLQILRECGNMTAREIAAELHRRGVIPTDERNFTAPRLTELSEAGLVRAVGKKICDKTGRRVAVWAAQSDEREFHAKNSHGE